MNEIPSPVGIPPQLLAQKRLMLSLLGFSFLVVAAQIVVAEERVFVVDAGRTTLTLRGGAGESVLFEQAPGSLAARFHGTIRLDVGKESINVLGGSILEGELSGDWQPLVGGGFGSAPAVFATYFGSLFVRVSCAVRNLAFVITKGTLNSGIPCGGGDNCIAFTQELLYSFSDASSPSLDYRIIHLPDEEVTQQGTQPISSEVTNILPPVGSARATIQRTGTTETLALPVDIAMRSEFPSPFVDAVLSISGDIIATHSIEPTPLVISLSLSADRLLSLEWSTTPGQSYTLEHSEDLIKWNALDSNLVATTESYVFTNNITGGFRFFRLVQ